MAVLWNGIVRRDGTGYGIAGVSGADDIEVTIPWLFHGHKEPADAPTVAIESSDDDGETWTTIHDFGELRGPARATVNGPFGDLIRCRWRFYEPLDVSDGYWWVWATVEADAMVRSVPT